MKKSFPWLQIIPLVFLGIFFFLPLGNILIKAWSGRTASWLNSVDQITRPLFFTLFQAGLSVLLTLLIGLPAAYLFSHYRFKGSTVLQVLTTIPFILPTVIVAAGFNALLGPNGWINSLLVWLFRLPVPPIHFLGTFTAILVAHIFYNTTIIIRVVGSSWQELNRKYEQAGKVLGANPWQVFKEITLPLLLPSLFAACLLVFLFDFTSFGVILMLGGPQFSTLETEIYIQSMNLLNLPLAAVLSAIQLFFTLLLTVVINQLSGKWSAAYFTRVNSEALSVPKKLQSQFFAYGYAFFLFLFFGSPLLGLFLRSFLNGNSLSLGSTSTFSLINYQELFVNQRNSLFYVPPVQAIANSVLFASATTLLSVILGLITVIGFKRKSGLSQILSPILMLPLGASAVILGLGFVVFFGQIPGALSFFPFLIPVVHSLVAYPFVVRALQPAVAAIPESLHSAAATLGASPSKIFWQIDIPVLKRPLIVAAIFAFSISLGEFGATIFLARPEYPTIPVAIYRFLAQPGALNYGQAMAMASILMALCALCTLMMGVFLPKRARVST